ncbi:PepSY domain-containing protein [Paracoccus sp. PXZ]
MKRSLTILTFLAALPSGAALAGDDCAVPLVDWQPRSAVMRLAEESGWVVRRIKIDDGCYEIKGTDREGHRIEVTVDPGTLQVIEIEYKDGSDRHSPEGRGRKHD